MRKIFAVLLCVVGLAVWGVATSVSAPAAAPTTAPVLKTAWGEPDIQGIWTDVTDTPLQRPTKFANQEFLSEAERAQLDKERAALLGRDKRVERGSEDDVAGAYNSVFQSMKHTGKRTSLIVDPPNGRMPPQTPEYAKLAAADRAFRLSMLRSTTTCKTMLPACAGGKYDPTPSPMLTQQPSRYNVGRMNRHDDPEDGSSGDRCFAGLMPDFGGFHEIIQTPGGITMYYDIGQGQGYQRNIVMNGSPHLPANIHERQGDSRGHWEGNTLVIDVSNFSPKVEYQGSRDHLHLVERYTRTSPTTIEYSVTIDDPTVWTHSWTIKQELTKQSDEEDKAYYEPRCYEGNYAFPSLMLAARMAEQAYADGKGPNPATADNATDFETDEQNPLQ